jgi:hypothetical protein
MELLLPVGFDDAVRDRRILPFIGAGFTKNVDKALPAWSAVMSRSAELLDYDPQILLSQGDYLQIAEYLSIKKRLGKLYKSLEKQIDNDALDVGASKPHLLLPYLDVQFIFTTNWDRWIEKGFEHQRIPYSKIITNDDFVSPRSFHPRRVTSIKSSHLKVTTAAVRRRFRETTIVKYHGDFSEHASIVFKESDYYNRLDFEHPLDIKLRSEIIGRSVLFLGYSFSDPNVRYIWHKLTKLMQGTDSSKGIKSFFVTHLNNPLLIDLFRRKNIETILLKPTNIADQLQTLFEHMISLQVK